GESIAWGLAEFGATVVVSSRKQEAVDEVATELRDSGYHALALACHVGDAGQRANLVEATLAKYGRVDILVNNAAINPYYGPFAQISDAAFLKTLQVNLDSARILSNLVYEPMQNQKSGSIIHISSIESFEPGNGMGAYSLSKAALNMLTKSQAKEWGRDGIRVNAIAPGLIKTKFSSALWQNQALMNFIEQQVPAGRAGEPEEIAGLAVFLASDAGSYCSGSIYVVDGGFLLATGL
ncbi:MAG: glucose 1-dehydrogenase, partial [Saprospiraceae bacterium]|nr:glucose 1-dehydrogenase [Saprospiraceae bacterium]